MFKSHFDELLAFKWHRVTYPPLSNLGIFITALNHLNFFYSCQIKHILYVYLVAVNEVKSFHFFSFSIAVIKKKQLYLGTDGSTACISICLKQLTPHM
jgi:hypothetical protein